LVCGGEERGTWLHDLGLSSPRSFGFALSLGPRESAGPALGRLRLEPSAESGSLALSAWFDLLQARQPFAGALGAGWRLTLQWS
jgi:hypothetical protein